MKSRTPLGTGLIAVGALAIAFYLLVDQRELQSSLAHVQSASAAQERQLAQLNRQLADLQRANHRLARLAVTHERTLLEPPAANPATVIRTDPTVHGPAPKASAGRPAPLSSIIAPFRARLPRPPYTCTRPRRGSAQSA